MRLPLLVSLLHLLIQGVQSIVIHVQYWLVYSDKLQCSNLHIKGKAPVAQLKVQGPAGIQGEKVKGEG